MQPAALNMAEHYFRQGDLASCLEFADRVVETSPSILRGDALRAQAYYYKSVAAWNEDDFASAVAWSKKGIADAPGSPPLLNTHALSLMQLRKHGEALPLLERLMVLSPNDATVPYNLACCRVRAENDLDGALRDLGLSMDRGFADIAHLRGDRDLLRLRTRRSADLEELLAMRLRPSMKWNILAGDELIIVNESRFALRDVTVNVVFVEAFRGTTASTKREVQIAYLAAGDQLRTNAVIDSTKAAFRGLELVAAGDQGSFVASYEGPELRELGP